MRKVWLAVGLILAAAYAGCHYWDQAPRRWAERITGLDLPALKLVYEMSATIDPAVKDLTRMLQFEDRDEAKPFLDCAFAGWRKDVPDPGITLELIGTIVPGWKHNCSRRLGNGADPATTMVFFDYGLFIKTTH